MWHDAGASNRVSRKAREGRAGAEAARRPRADPCPRAHATCPSALWLCQKHLEGTMPQRAVRTRTLLSVPPLLQPPGSPGRRVIAGPGSSGTWRAPGPMPRLGQCGGLSDSRHAGVCGHRLARGAEGEGCSGAVCRRGAAPAPRRGRSQSSEHQHGLAAQDAQAAACQARVWRRMRCHRGCRRWPRSGTPCAQGLGQCCLQVGPAWLSLKSLQKKPFGRRTATQCPVAIVEVAVRTTLNSGSSLHVYRSCPSFCMGTLRLPARASCTRPST